mmetsp:Transcript_33888/g.76147  ORF Transcript_33888/g.76147 Transcript_33888/m.76147 type:complete len:165 (-) Transcript_33888:4447-4941(-)
MQQASFILNSLFLSPLDEHKTVWEQTFGVRPDITNFFPFGCKAFVILQEEQRSDHFFSDKSVPTLYLGYSNPPAGNSAHYFLAEETLKIYGARKNFIIVPDQFPHRIEMISSPSLPADFPENPCFAFPLQSADISLADPGVPSPQRWLLDRKPMLEGQKCWTRD